MPWWALTAAWMLEEIAPRWRGGCPDRAGGAAAAAGRAASQRQDRCRAKTRAGKTNKTAETQPVSAGKPPRGREDSALWRGVNRLARFRVRYFTRVGRTSLP